MQRIDLSKHHPLWGIVNGDPQWEDLPRRCWWEQPEKLELWILWDEPIYRWRGLIHKVTAHRQTFNIDWSCGSNKFKLHSSDRSDGQICDIIFVVP